MQASAAVLISGNASTWKVAESFDPQSTVHERTVSLEIQGDAKHGYPLVMTPAGCFAADSWHTTIEDALETAQRLFDVSPDAWIRRPSNRA